MNKEKEILYKLLYEALIEIRYEAHEINSKKIFWIAKILHRLPLELLNQRKSYSEIMEALSKNVESVGMQKWLDNRLAEIEGKMSED